MSRTILTMIRSKSNPRRLWCYRFKAYCPAGQIPYMARAAEYPTARVRKGSVQDVWIFAKRSQRDRFVTIFRAHGATHRAAV